MAENKVLEQAAGDFNWEQFENEQDLYSGSEQKEYADKYEETLTSIEEHEVIEGTVVLVTKKEDVLVMKDSLVKIVNSQKMKKTL